MKKKDRKDSISILLIIFLIFITRIFISNKVKISGCAYLFSAIDFIMLFVVFLPYSLKHIVSKLVNAKIKGMQGSNARRVIYGAFFMVFIYSVISSVILLALKNVICDNLLLGNASYSVYVYLISIIILSGIMSVIKGYFLGVKETKIIGAIEIGEKIIVFLFVVIFSGAYFSYGRKVSKVLYNKEYEYAFGAIGVSIGLCVGLLISVIVAFIIYKLNLHHLKNNDSDKKNDDIYDVFSWISRDVFRNSGFIFIALFTHVICQLIYFKSMNTSLENAVLSYRWGNYAGNFFNILLIPVLYFYCDSFIQKKSLKIAIKSTNVSELRIKLNDSLSSCLIIAIPTSLFVFVCAGPLVNGIGYYESAFGVLLVRCGAFCIIPLSFAITTSNILNGIGKYNRLIFNSFASMILSIFSYILMNYIFKFEIFGVLITLYIYMIVLSFFNYYSIKTSLKFSLDLLSRTLPSIIVSAINTLFIFLLNLLLGLFMNDFMIAIISIIIFALVEFIALAKFNIINAYSVSRTILDPIFGKIGKMFKII